MEISVQEQLRQNCICCSSQTRSIESLIFKSWKTPSPLFHTSKLNSKRCYNSSNIDAGLVKYRNFGSKTIRHNREGRKQCRITSSRQLSVYGKRIKASFISPKHLRKFIPRKWLTNSHYPTRTIKAMSHTENYPEEHPNTCNRGTLTIPIEFQSHSTQTDILEEDSDDVEDEIKHFYSDESKSKTYQQPPVRDQCTSPIFHQHAFSSAGATGYSKTYFENLEKLTGHIIIHRFITRNEEEFQHLIQISFPQLKQNSEVGEESEIINSSLHTPNISSSAATTNKSVSMTLIPLLEENEENKNNDLQQNSSLSNQDEQTTKKTEQMNNEDHNILTSKEPTFLSKVSNELEKEGTGRLPCQNDIGLNEFRISLDTLLEEDKEEGVGEENDVKSNSSRSGSDSNNDDNESTVAVGDAVITSMSTKFLEEKERRELLLTCDSNESSIPCECFPFRITTSDNNNFNLSNEAEVGTKTKTTEEIVDSDDEDSSSIIHSVNYFGEKDDGESETESIASSVNEEVVEAELAIPSKNIATQTDEKSFCKYFKKLKSVNLSANSNATSTSESSSMSLLDVELHVEKLDLRVRVGGRKQKKKRLDKEEAEKSLEVGIRRNDKSMNMTRRQLHLKPIDEKPNPTTSTTGTKNEDGLDFLEVKGRRILL